VVAAALDRPRDPFLDYAIRLSARALQRHWSPALASGALTLGSPAQRKYLTELAGSAPKEPAPGETLYEMACLACHQPEAKGLPGVYPPLSESAWARGDKSRLIKIVLHGLTGPIEVKGKKYGGPGAVPMPAMGGLTDQQIAEVLTYVRSAFGNKASAVTPAEVSAIRAVTATRETPWTVTELNP